MSTQNKRQRTIVGDMLKAKEGAKSNAPYIKVSQDVVLKKGDIISVESKTYQLSSLEAAAKAGKITPEYFEKRKAEIERTPAFVMGKLILSTNV